MSRIKGQEILVTLANTKNVYEMNLEACNMVPNLMEAKP